MGTTRSPTRPTDETLWGDCKAEQVGPNFPENTKERCLDGIDNDCDGRTNLGDSKCDAYCSPKQTASCYTADSKTLNVGPCRTGLKTCKEDNTWGSCVRRKSPRQRVLQQTRRRLQRPNRRWIGRMHRSILPRGRAARLLSRNSGLCTRNHRSRYRAFSLSRRLHRGIQTCRKGSWGACEKRSAPPPRSAMGSTTTAMVWSMKAACAKTANSKPVLSAHKTKRSASVWSESKRASVENGGRVRAQKPQASSIATSWTTTVMVRSTTIASARKTKIARRACFAY